MKAAILILSLLLIYKAYEVNKLQQAVIELSRDNNHLKGQIIKANEQVIEWNKNYLCKDYAKRNGLTNLKQITQ